jgi:HSP20 family protein
MRNEDREFSLIRSGRRAMPSGRLWNPAADVYQTKDGWLVKIDLAGICSDELEIDIRDSRLRITGCRRDAHCHDSLVYHQLEITYSRFEKTIQFPAPIEGAALKRDYSDGFLIINLHRGEDA